MRTRTRLTTPPGEEPSVDEGLRVRDPERYSPALAAPVEPDVPGRFRRLGVTLAVLVLLGVLGYAAFQLANAGQFQDPSLDERGGEELDGGGELDAPAVEDPAVEDPAVEEPTPTG